MHRLRFLSALLSLLLCAACYTSSLRINLNEDGGGTLVLTSTASSGLLAYVQQRFGMGLEERFFGEAQLKQAAKTFGPTVEFRRRNVFDQEDGKVFIATYVFSDINTVRVGTAATLPSMATSETADAFGFSYTNRLLTVRAPPLPALPPESPHVKVEAPDVVAMRQARFEANRKALMAHGNPFRLRGAETPEELSRQLMRGLAFRVDLSLPSTILAGTASHVDKDAQDRPLVILMDIGAEDLLQSESFMERMGRGQAQGLNWQEIARLPGIRVETNEVSRVRF